MNILGISAFYHDSAACLVQDGRIVGAAQEERFTRKKHDERFPKHAIDYCLAEAGIRPEQVDVVAFYDKPLLKFDRLIETYVCVLADGLQDVPARPPRVAQAEAAHVARDRSRPRRHLQGAVHVPRASRVARRERLLPVAV